MKKSDAAVLAGKHLRALALGKRNYSRADAALAALIKVMQVGQTVTLKGGKKFELIDEFSDNKLTVFKPCGVRRFKLEEILEP